MSPLLRARPDRGSATASCRAAPLRPPSLTRRSSPRCARLFGTPTRTMPPMAISAIPCPGCGFTAPAGARDCRERFEELCARDFGDYRYGRVHRRMVDAYCLQHPETHCVSAKSLAAHLVGLCIAAGTTPVHA